MSPALELALILVLVAMLAAVAALAGALWWRSRTASLVEVARLAGELADRQRALEGWLARLDAGGLGRPVAGPKRRPGPRAEPGPTLIAVPDLAAAPAEGPAAAASAELARRFGAIWALADAGAAPESIARGTGQPIGQVELILGLRRQLDAVATGGHHA